MGTGLGTAEWEKKKQAQDRDEYQGQRAVGSVMGGIDLWLLKTFIILHEMSRDT